MPLSRAWLPGQFRYVPRAGVPAPAFGLRLAVRRASSLAILAAAELRVDGCRATGQQAAPLAGKNRRAKLPDLLQTRLVRLLRHARLLHARVRRVRVRARVPPERRRGFRCETRGGIR